MKYLLIVKGDTNDADYITSQNMLDEEEYQRLLPILQKVAAVLEQPITHQTRHGLQHHDWPNGDTLREDLGEVGPRELHVGPGKLTREEYENFDEYVPYGENGIHTLTSITVHQVVDTQQLYPAK